MPKSMFRVALRAAVCCSVVGAPSVLAQSTTYVVDDNGGPGVNFTDLPLAIAAAQPGDVLSVRPGSYSSFTLGKGLTIVGEFGAVVDAGTHVVGLPADERAVICAIDFGALSVSACSGNVTVDECSFTGQTTATGLVRVSNSTDVRFHRTKIFAEVRPNSSLHAGSSAVVIDASRVEFSSCVVRGGDGGAATSFGSGGKGGVGIECSAGGRAHVALTNVTGGKGGKGVLYGPSGGDGGPGIGVYGGGAVIVAGTPNNFVRGGNMGTPWSMGFQNPGSGVRIGVGSSLRYSGSTIDSGAPYLVPAIHNFGTVLHATPDDPTLEMIGHPSAGASVQLVVHGVAGMNARLQQGNQMLVVDDGQTEIERLDNRIRLHPLGPIPTGGSIAYTMNVPASWPVGRLRLFQGQEVDAATGALLERTNSAFVIVH